MEKTDSTAKSKEMLSGAIDICACFHLRKASRAVSKLYDDVLAPSGLRSTQFVMLVNIFINEPTTLRNLSRSLVTERSTLSRNIKPLEKMELVKSSLVAGKKSKEFVLTEKGKQLVLETAALWSKAQNQFVDGIGEENWETLRKVLPQAVDSARLAQ